MSCVKTVLTIAGSDSSGGAGIQADLKTITAQKLYGSSAITAVTAQNTTGVSRICILSPELLKAQLDAVFTDIFPDAVKIGMAGSEDSIRVIGDRLRFYRPAFVVLDPVMISTSGHRLLSEAAAKTMIQELFPLSTLITPNVPEGQFLLELSGGSGKPHSGSHREMEQTALCLEQTFSIPVLLKGGHMADRVNDNSGEDETGSEAPGANDTGAGKGSNAADDLLCREASFTWFYGERIDAPNTHGTGCTLSSAVACGLAKGLSLAQSILQAKQYVTGALGAGLNLGKGSGPICHMWNL